MSKLPKKYIPGIILIFLVLFAWAEEAFIGEGYFSAYFHLPEHKGLRFFIKGIYVVIIFAFGYFGLSNLSAKWVKVLWLYWYALAVVAGGLRVVLDIYLTQYFNNDLWGFLSAIYFLSYLPFPYLFLWMMALLFKPKPDSKQ